MKVAIVTLGLLDTMMPLVRHMSEKAEIDLYISVYGDRFADTISSFDLSNLPLGLIDKATTEKILGEDLMNYLMQGNKRVSVHLFKYPSLKIFNWQNFQLHREFAKAINKKHYDAVHFNGYRGSLLFLYSFLKRKTAKAWTIHDPFLHSGEEKWQTTVGYSTYRFLNGHFILHNQTQLPSFVKRYKINPARVHFVPLGPYDVFKVFQKGPDVEADPNTVLFYGRISPYKGVETLIQATIKAKKQLPDLKVIIAGKPNYPIDLDAIRDVPGFEVRDRFIENEELVKLIQQSSLVVCPYTDATQSGVVMTAYAFNKPVLATAVGGLPEMVDEGETGRLVPPKDAEALTQTMVDMLSDKEALYEMQQKLKARTKSGKFSWNKISDQTLEVYRKAMADKKKK